MNTRIGKYKFNVDYELFINIIKDGKKIGENFDINGNFWIGYEFKNNYYLSNCNQAWLCNYQNIIDYIDKIK